MLTLHGHRQFEIKKVCAEHIVALEAQKGDMYDDEDVYVGLVVGSCVHVSGGGKFWVLESLEVIESLIESANALEVFHAQKGSAPWMSWPSVG